MKAFRVFSVVMIVILAWMAIQPWAVQSASDDPIGEAARASRDLPAVQVDSPPVDQLIIKYKAVDGVQQADPSQADQLDRLSAAAGLELAYFRPMSGDAHVLKLPQPMPESEAARLAAQLAVLPEVEYAEPDAIMQPMVTPNDPEYINQWHYFAPGPSQYGINAPAAWDITTGSPSVWVAVIDTGITDHPDLAGRWSGGYDFITDPDMGNDSNGRDSDPHDVGDWVTANECYAGSSARDSSWHGTHVAGTIGAKSNNGVGVAGINWQSMILPIRVLGKCGGYTSDIADGMRWAAGLPVAGVPNNPNPAKVLNLSLGGYGTCDSSYQNAVNDIVAAGATLVISAGNSNDDSQYYRPGNCNNVITVAASDRDGNRAYYSNYGSVVEISAPGGAQSYSNDPDGVLSTLNSGATVPATPNYEYYQGTSMAAPHVSGVASLLYSLNPALTPAQVLSTLQSSVTVFPAGSSCNTSICGTGILNAFEAVKAANGVPSGDKKLFLPLILKDLPATTTPPPGGWTAFEIEVVNLANQERAANGCYVVLTMQDQLHQAAYGHSADMLARDFFSHTNPDGDGPGDRLDAVGYDWWSWGENIAAGYPTPANVMAAWMSSSGHRANILNCDYTEIGIGYVYSASDPGNETYHHYWTMVLAEPY